MTYVALIPLRGGSKSIPHKNIRPIAGKPLCLWTIEAAAFSSRIDAVYVATDSDAIREIVEAANLPKVKVIDRSPETATDTASTESIMLEFAAKYEFERLVLIQATSPLLTSDDLDQGVRIIESSGADTLLSVVAQKRFIWQRRGNGISTPENYDPVKRPRRQDFDGYQVENGAFYISGREGLMRTGSRLYGTVAAYEMPEETFHELDEPVDFIIIEKFLEARRSDVGLGPAANRIKLLLSDVDGVLTDSGMYYSETGDESKKFNTRDGKGFELLRNAGIKVGIITAEKTELVARRAKKLKLDFLIQGSTDKVEALREILRETGFAPDEVAFVGDDLGDVGILGVVGFSACPADAVREAKVVSRYRANAKGGEGVIREVAELILAERAR